MRRSIIFFAALAALAMSAAGCDHKLSPRETLVTFDSKDYPLLYGAIYVDQPLDGQKIVLHYRQAAGQQMSVWIPEQYGISCDQFTVTLADGEGYIDVPLSGTPQLKGPNELTIYMRYGIYTLSNTANIGVRPTNVADFSMVPRDPNLPNDPPPYFAGQLYSDIPASTCNVWFDYIDGWGRTATIWFECEQEPALNSASVNFRLLSDADRGRLVVPLSGTPQFVGAIDLVMHLKIDEEQDEHVYTFPLEILPANPYVQQDVSHTIIITDRNDLLSNPAAIQTATFTYKTVFVDIDGDGYVSDNYEVWLDRNVGATSTDPDQSSSYGFYYQAGRNAPGQVTIGGTNGNTPGAANTMFRGEDYESNNYCWYNDTANDVVVHKLNYDGTQGAEVVVEAGKVGPCNPCPYGFRPPKASEWQLLYDFLGCKSTNPNAMRTGLLKIPFAGGYLGNNATALTEVGTDKGGCYWTCSPIASWNGQVNAVYFQNPNIAAGRGRGFGLPVRCVMAKESELATY